MRPLARGGEDRDITSLKENNMECKHTPSPFDPCIEDEGYENEFQMGVVDLSIRCSKCGHIGTVRFTWDCIDWDFNGQGPILGADK